MNEVASRYALALYSLALETNSIESWQEEVKEIMRAFKENADFVMVLGSSFLTVQERKQMLNETLKGVSEEIVSLLNIVIENHRTSLIPEILEGFNTYCNENKGVLQGLLYSHIHLKESQITEIEQKISEVEHVKVHLKNVIDPTLIGGVKIVIHDRIYDGSIKHHLTQMRKDLLKKEGK